VRLAARTGYGFLPQTTLGEGQLHAGLVTRHASIELGGSLSGRQSLAVPELNQIRRVQHASLQLQGCGELTRGSINLRLCLGLEGGLLVIRTANSPVRPWMLHLTGCSSMTWWWHRHLGLNVSATVGPALVRPSFFYFGPGPGFDVAAERRVPALLISGSLGLEFRFPALREREAPKQ
jgi:hypothetical protein